MTFIEFAFVAISFYIAGYANGHEDTKKCAARRL